MTITHQPWELEFLDWDRTGVDGAPVQPSYVLKLASAGSEDAATRAYWKLDGVVCANGVTYAAALPTTQAILALLPSCSIPARRYALELLGQIAAGESEPRCPDVVERCLGELQKASWYLLHGLQFDDVAIAWLYVDLVGLLAHFDPEFRERARQYLSRVLTRKLPPADAELVRNTLSRWYSQG